MRTIYLSENSTCRGHLCKLQSPQVIGCAMGEVLFQAGVPLDILAQHDTTYSLLWHYPRFVEALAEYLGICLTEPDVEYGEDSRRDSCGWYKVFEEIESMYDHACTQPFGNLPYSYSRIELYRLGRQIGINFVWGPAPQEIHGVPVPSTPQALAPIVN